ncbi:dethiobiotin synthase [Streptacidiphilus fuscans]|uniref:ATP-dependent dethiobiotin synthetase BioD n=1 Tax=Streptacidiphilus fuscans TaxID=2789292 RepID=A0A931B955_9ACTN|nr:dethiobiotin synthase [Streptacidiphilus fuscans]MBF9070058.1 ATP-dependent dethiobiotin synthetase BioD [Streptacidiphilus fuscans]
MTCQILLVTGTNTEIGKTVTTAAVAALARDASRRVAVLKPAQTGVAPGEPGDVDEVLRLAGTVTVSELGRYPEPLAPGTAAARSGLPPVTPAQIAEEVARLAETHDLVLVEGAGGLLVRFDAEGSSLADVPAALTGLGLQAEVLLVVTAGLGTLNLTELSAEALRARSIPLHGLVIGGWPAEPDLAMRCNLADLPLVADAPLLGALPERCAGPEVDPESFLKVARASLAPTLGGDWSLA